ncbi:ABC transporter substrate-binding protein [Solirubrobacter taibaiensis]|nr:ABC transporter substrate-binding protein [Solirubrobacter taibaiensis]
MGTISRRALLKGFGGAMAAAAMPVGFVGCGDATDPKRSGGVGTVSIGSNASDPAPKASYEKVFAAFQAETGGEVRVNTADHNTFQQQINAYLQGRPDDAFMWFAGYRMQFFAERGLATDISDVWDHIGPNFSASVKHASTGLDGKQYLVPFDSYPWAIFYRKSVFEEKGYAIPETYDALKDLASRMRDDGLTPFAFADKEGWPAMGTFDILNLRINGYDFHMQLMKGAASWQDPKVAAVFDTWRELLPFHQQGALGRTWQEAAGGLANKTSGMYLLGMYVGQQFPEADREDLDFFAFPEIDSRIGADALDAPINGFMLSRAPRNEDGAKALLEFLASATAQNLYAAADPTTIVTNEQADTSGYSALQQKAVKLVSAATNVAQFMDRDTRPDFASTVMIPALQAFIQHPDDVAGLTKRIEDQKKTIFAS